MVALAPVVAWFYKEPELLLLTAVIALKYVIDSLSVVQIALLNREMRFKTLAGIQIGSTVISGLAGLGMALYGMGPWSLVAQTLGASVVLFAVSWRLGKLATSLLVRTQGMQRTLRVQRLCSWI